MMRPTDDWLQTFDGSLRLSGLWADGAWWPHPAGRPCPVLNVETREGEPERGDPARAEAIRASCPRIVADPVAARATLDDQAARWETRARRVTYAIREALEEWHSMLAEDIESVEDQWAFYDAAQDFWMGLHRDPPGEEGREALERLDALTAAHRRPDSRYAEVLDAVLATVRPEVARCFADVDRLKAEAVAIDDRRLLCEVVIAESLGLVHTGPEAGSPEKGELVVAVEIRVGGKVKSHGDNEGAIRTRYRRAVAERVGDPVETTRLWYEDELTGVMQAAGKLTKGESMTVGQSTIYSYTEEDRKTE